MAVLMPRPVRACLRIKTALHIVLHIVAKAKNIVREHLMSMDAKPKTYAYQKMTTVNPTALCNAIEIRCSVPEEKMNMDVPKPINALKKIPNVQKHISKQDFRFDVRF